MSADTRAVPGAGPVADGAPTPNKALIEVRGLVKHFPLKGKKADDGRAAVVRAVDGIDFMVYERETLGVVGESGCGKSTAARLLMRLLDPTAGEIIFDGKAVGGRELPLKEYRRQVQMVFQDSYSSLNPRMTIEDSIAFGPMVHGVPRREALARAHDLLNRVGLAPGGGGLGGGRLCGGLGRFGRGLRLLGVVGHVHDLTVAERHLALAGFGHGVVLAGFEDRHSVAAGVGLEVGVGDEDGLHNDLPFEIQSFDCKGRGHMSEVKMKREEPAFVFLEKLVLAAIKDHVERESSWEITKVPFEEHWEVQPLNEETQESFELCTDETCVEFDLAQDDDPESLTNCYVDVHVVGTLAELLAQYGVRPQFKIDVFNDAQGHSIFLAGAADVENNVSLLHVWIDDVDKVLGLADELEYSGFVDLIQPT